MAFIPVANVAQVMVRGTLNGENTENTLYYKRATGITQAMLDELVVAVGLSVFEDWIPYLPAEWSLREVYAKDMSAAVSVQATNTDGAGEPGGRTTVALPNNVTIAIQRSSGLTGRNSRGRIFWQGLTEGDVVANVIDSGLLAGIVAALELTDIAAVAVNWLPVIVSLYENNLPRAAGVTYDILTWKWVDNVIDSARQRLPGRGT